MKIKYAAHIILTIRVKDSPQVAIPFYENIVLVYADSYEEAIDKAKQIGEAEAADGSDDFVWDERPAEWVFAGVRKVVECRSPGKLDDRIGHGTEVSYSLMSVANEDDLTKLVEGEPVDVFYEE